MENSPLLGKANRKQKTRGIAVFGSAALLVTGVIAWFACSPAAANGEKLSLSQSHFEMNPRTKAFQSFAKGPVPVEFHIATNPVFAVRSEVYKLPSDPPILVEITSDDGILKANVTSDKKFEVHDHQKVKIFVDLPLQQLATLFDIDVGSIDWKGTGSFTDLVTKVHVGSTRFETIEANSVDLVTDVGSIKIDEASTESYHSKVSTGNMEATVKDYSEALVKVSVGSVSGAFQPKYLSNTTVGISTGSLNCRVIGYEGNFDLRSSTGSIKVAGSDIHYSDKRKFPVGHAVKGTRGTKVPGSNHLDANTSIGSINIVFQ
jgi:hypothetical protein